MTVHPSGIYLITDSTKILWLHGSLQQRANGNINLIQLSDPTNQFFWFFRVASEVDAKVMLSKPFQYCFNISNIASVLFHGFRPGRFCQGRPPLCFCQDEDGRVDYWNYFETINNNTKSNRGCKGRWKLIGFVIFYPSQKLFVSHLMEGGRACFRQF